MSDYALRANPTYWILAGFLPDCRITPYGLIRPTGYVVPLFE